MKMENISEMFIIGVMSGLVSGFVILWQDENLFTVFSTIGLVFISFGVLCFHLCEDIRERKKGLIFIIIGLILSVLEFILNLWIL